MYFLTSLGFLRGHKIEIDRKIQKFYTLGVDVGGGSYVVRSENRVLMKL